VLKHTDGAIEIHIPTYI